MTGAPGGAPRTTGILQPETVGQGVDRRTGLGSPCLLGLLHDQAAELAEPGQGGAVEESAVLEGDPGIVPETLLLGDDLLKGLPTLLRGEVDRIRMNPVHGDVDDPVLLVHGRRVAELFEALDVPSGAIVVRNSGCLHDRPSAPWYLKDSGAHPHNPRCHPGLATKTKIGLPSMGALDSSPRRRYGDRRIRGYGPSALPRPGRGSLPRARRPDGCPRRASSGSPALGDT